MRADIRPFQSYIVGWCAILRPQKMWDHTNDVFWLVLAIGAFVLGVVWGLINKPK